jgi:hypothetical protein
VLEARKTLKIIYSTVFKKKATTKSINHLYDIFWGTKKSIEIANRK